MTSDPLRISFCYRRPWHRVGWCGNFVDERLGGIGTSLSYDVWRPTLAWTQRATRKKAGGMDAAAFAVYTSLREEWEVLGMLSYTGDGRGGWRADLNQDDIAQIRVLLRTAAEAIAGPSG